MIEFSSKSAKETIALGEKLAKNLDGGTVVAFTAVSEWARQLLSAVLQRAWGSLVMFQARHLQL